MSNGHNRPREWHGMSDTPEYHAWVSLRQRCSNPSDKRYADYGGRGIKSTPAWDVFTQFYADMGPRPAGTSLDRIDNDGDYEPGNCRWATAAEQRANRRPIKRPDKCSRGHAFTPENTKVFVSGPKAGRRECITCRRTYQRERNARKKATP